MVPDGWRIEPFGTLARKPATVTPAKVKRSAYLSSGLFPIVDQGKGLIAGYTNDSAELYGGPLPVIVFGDHTREWKFIDFPFAVGADGTQLIVPQPSIESRFLYYALANLKIRSRGYSRHFSLVKQERLPAPPLPEQKKIAEILQSVDEAIQKTEAVVEQTERVKKGLLQQLLTRGMPGRHTRFKQTEIGEMPESWEVVSCSQITTQISVGIVVRPASYYEEKGVRCFRSANVRENRVDDQNWVHISAESNQVHAKSILRSGDVLVVRSGYPGTACVVPPELDGCNCVDIIFARPEQSCVVSEYLSLFVNSDEGKGQVLRDQAGLAQKHFNVGALKRMLVAIPSIEEQQDIVERIQQVGAAVVKNHSCRQSLQATKQGLMNDLLTGRVRVSV